MYRVAAGEPKETHMSVRINVIVHEETVSARGKSHLAEQLKAGALANADRDLAIAEEWLPLEEEAGQQHTTPRPRVKK